MERSNIMERSNMVIDVTDVFWEFVHAMSACDDVEDFRTTQEFEALTCRIQESERSRVPLVLATSSISDVSRVDDVSENLEFQDANGLFRGVLAILYRTEDRVRTMEMQRCIEIMESWGVLQDLCGHLQQHHIEE